VRLSPSEKEAEQEAVVRVRRSACDSVTDKLELVGVFSLGFALPQYLYKIRPGSMPMNSVGAAYLTTAMLTGAVTEALLMSAILIR
jgi:hypothetical protein